MEEFRLSNGEVFVTGDRVQFRTHNGLWNDGVVVSRQAPDNTVPIMVGDDSIYVTGGHEDDAGMTAAQNAEERARRTTPIIFRGPGDVVKV